MKVWVGEGERVETSYSASAVPHSLILFENWNKCACVIPRQQRTVISSDQCQVLWVTSTGGMLKRTLNRSGLVLLCYNVLAFGNEVHVRFCVSVVINQIRNNHRPPDPPFWLTVELKADEERTVVANGGKLRGSC